MTSGGEIQSPFLSGRASCRRRRLGAGLCHSFRGRARPARKRAPPCRNQLLGRGRARRHGDHPRRACRDGAGRDDRRSPCWSPKNSNAIGTRSAPNSVSPQENAPQPVWGDTSTGASRSIASSQLYLRQAGATAREMLIAAAAAQWKVPAARMRGEKQHHHPPPSGRTVTFGAVAARRRQDSSRPTDVALKEPDAWTLIGKPRKRLDVLAKITGQPVLRHRRQVAEHALRRDRPMSGIRRHAASRSTKIRSRHEEAFAVSCGCRTRSPWSRIRGGGPSAPPKQLKVTWDDAATVRCRARNREFVRAG